MEPGEYVQNKTNFVGPIVFWLIAWTAWVKCEDIPSASFKILIESAGMWHFHNYSCNQVRSNLTGDIGHALYKLDCIISMSCTCINLIKNLKIFTYSNKRQSVSNPHRHQTMKLKEPWVWLSRQAIGKLYTFIRHHNEINRIIRMTPIVAITDRRRFREFTHRHSQRNESLLFYWTIPAICVHWIHASIPEQYLLFIAHEQLRVVVYLYVTTIYSKFPCRLHLQAVVRPI